MSKRKTIGGERKGYRRQHTPDCATLNFGHMTCGEDCCTCSGPWRKLVPVKGKRVGS